MLDATVGRNALSQEQAFGRLAYVSGIVMTKLDGTAKGGVVFAVTEAVKVPVMFVGTGEKMDDIADFDPDDFVDALVGDGRV